MRRRCLTLGARSDAWLWSVSLLLLALLTAAPSFSSGGAPISAACVLDAALAPEPAPLLISKCTRGKLRRSGDEVSFTAKDASGAYRVLGQRGGDTVVQWSGTTGGSGAFSGVSLFRVEKGRLVLSATLWTGDRCTGGVESARIDSEAIVVTVNATPSDFAARLRAVDRTLPKLSLPGSAVDCVGTLELEVAPEVDPRVVRFTLAPVAPRDDECTMKALAHFAAAHPGPRVGAELQQLTAPLTCCSRQDCPK